MTHRQAILWLAEYPDGPLPPSIAASLGLHLRRCEACRHWLETKQHLETLLAAASPFPHVAESVDHPSSELLALCVVRPEELEEADRSGLRAHLITCSTCAQEVDLLSQAVAAARPGAATQPSTLQPPHRHFNSRRRPPLSALLAAAAFFVLLLASGLFIFNTPLPIPPGTPEFRHDQTALPRTAGTLEILDSNLISGDGLLVISDVHVTRGAHLTLRSGDGVALGAHFRVNQGGTLAVELSTRHAARSPLL